MGDCGRDGPNVLATRYAGADLAAIWSPEHKIVLERRLWIAVLEAQRDLGVAVPDGVVEAYRDVVDKVDLDSIAARERVTRHDVKARDRGVLRAGRARAHPQGDDQPRPDRERRAAPGPPVPGAAAGPRGRRPGPAGPAGHRARDHRDGRPLAQRRGAGDHAGQALRDHRRRDADRARPGRRPARPLPAARHQGPDGHLAGHARPARRRRRQAGRPRAAGRPPPRLPQGAHQRRAGLPALARLRRPLRAGAAGRRARPTSPPRSG